MARAGVGGVSPSEKSLKKIDRGTVVDWLPLVPFTAKFVGSALLDERPVTVTVLDWPAVTDDGLKVQVPLVQERAMVPWNELGAAAVTVNVVEVVPIRRTVDLAFAARENSALPVPDSVTVCGPLAASSSKVKVPGSLPDDFGDKVTLVLQAAPTFKTVGRFPHVLVSV